MLSTKRILESPTFMSWLNISARMLSVVVVLPLVLRNFDEGDVALYFLFASAITMQTLIAGGIVSSFSRFVTYGLSGATFEDFARGIFDGKSARRTDVSSEVISRIRGTMRKVFCYLALIGFALLGIAGTLLLIRPVAGSSNAIDSWAAWGAILLVSPLNIYGLRFNAFLRGANKVALEQRWSALFAIFASLSGVIVLLLNGNIFALIVSNQCWLVVGYFRNLVLEKQLTKTIPYSHRCDHYDALIFRSVWGPSWRSLVGVLMSNGVAQMSGFFYAQHPNLPGLASYLLGLRLIGVITEVSKAPFYSKIPMFNRLRASGEIKQLRDRSFTAMRLSHALYIFAVITGLAFGDSIFQMLNSSVNFPSRLMWSVLGTAFMIERFGAMHMQVYSTTNRIEWHVANGISGSITLGLMIVLFGTIGVYSFPFAMIVGYLCYYSTVVPFKSYKSLIEL